MRFLPLQCWTGWDEWSTLPFPNLQPNAAPGSHHLPIVGEDRKVSVFVHTNNRRFRSAWDDFMAWRYDMQESASTKSNPCPAWSPLCSETRVPDKHRWSSHLPWRCCSQIHGSCVSQHHHMPKCLAAPNPNNEATKNASSRIEHSQVGSGCARCAGCAGCALGHRSRAAWPAR